MHKSFFNSVILILCSGLFLLSSCSKSEDKKTSTQIAAKVNGAEITMHQINLVMKNAKNVTAENVAAIRQQVLDKLIDQQIIVEKANKESLDRTPEVIMTIEAAKKDILANAYLQKLVANATKVSDSDIHSYFDGHPGLFSKRRIYNFQDIGMARDENLLVTLKEEVAKQKTMQEHAAWLKEKGIKFSAGSYSNPAEQIPLNLLPNLENLKDGEMVLVEINNTIHLIQLVNSQDAPIDLAAATPFIKNYYINIRGKEAVEEKIKKFRKEAKVEYMGDFANSVKTVKETEPTASKELVPPAKDKNTKDSAIEAGVAGLK